LTTQKLINQKEYGRTNMVKCRNCGKDFDWKSITGFVKINGDNMITDFKDALCNDCLKKEKSK